ncbi:MAG: chromate efflux transporter [Rhodospirillaceae bacterium]|nr:chromate efflux transporter [Rhodospirillaceae bacterium]
MDMHGGSASEVARAFLKLGLTSFGGPVAHLGYFREEFVRRRAWLSDAAFADIVALCQFLPGPASSQTAMALGHMRAGPLGALAAWAGFTAPSALLMILFAFALLARTPVLNGPVAVAVVHGLKLVAVPIVAQALCAMARALCPDLRTAAVAVLCGLAAALAPGGLTQLGVIASGALAGVAFLRGADAHGPRPATRSGAAAVFLAAFAALLVVLPLVRGFSPLLDLADAMYRAGALVFGGGHVVLPLLREAVVTPGWLSDATFLAGYGAAQAVPGPLFSFAAFVGTLVRQPPLGLAGGIVALVMIFLPGALLLFGAWPFWQRLQADPRARGALRGANAAVVGLLAAALYSPVGVTAITQWTDAAIAVAGFALLAWRRIAPWIVVLVTVLASVAAALPAILR